MGLARIFSETTLGSSKEIFSQHHLPSWKMFAMVRLVSYCVSKPSISSLIELPLIHLLPQNWRVELVSTFQHMPLSNRGNPTLIAVQMEEHGSLSGSLEFLLGCEQFLFNTVLAHNESLSWYSLQLSLARRAMFFALAACMPNPPSSFGLIILFHPTRYNFFFSMDEPQRKSLLILSIFSQRCTGKTAPYIT